jgi:hypothetical protein
MCKEASVIPSKNVIHPQKLTVAEIADPYQVIYELFDFAHLPRIQELLWEFFKTTVIGNYTHDLHRRDKAIFETYPFSPDNIDSFKLERLIRAFKVDSYLHENLITVVETIIRVTNAEKLFWSGFKINSRNRPQFDFIVLFADQCQIFL